MTRFGGNVDDFIANEMKHIEDDDGGGGTGADQAKPTMRPSVGIGSSGVKSLTSKPNFGVSAGKKPSGAFAKPGFALSKKPTVVSGGPPVISKASFNPMGGGPPKMTLGRKRQQDDDFIKGELAQIQKGVRLES